MEPCLYCGKVNTVSLRGSTMHCCGCGKTWQQHEGGRNPPDREKGMMEAKIQVLHSPDGHWWNIILPGADIGMRRNYGYMTPGIAKQYARRWLKRNMPHVEIEEE